MNTEIYYFTGTGNSLYVAREIKKRVPDSKLVPIIPLLNKNTIRIKTDSMGIVFPNFCLSIPIPVFDFITKADITSVDYIFAVCTRGGSPSEAFEYLDLLIKKQGKKIDAAININMPWNHPDGKANLPAMNTKKMIEKLDKNMQAKIKQFSDIILSKRQYRPEDTEVTLPLPKWASIFKFSMSFNFKSHRFAYEKLVSFYSDSKCKKCGICEHVCPGGKITVSENGPVWDTDKRCFYCFACINYCPEKAIQTKSNFFNKSYSKVNERYHHSAITYKVIADEKIK